MAKLTTHEQKQCAAATVLIVSCQASTSTAIFGFSFCPALASCSKTHPKFCLFRDSGQDVGSIRMFS